MSSETTWRRRWKHTLNTVAWKPLLKTKGKYFIKCLFTQDSYEILISDLTRSFYERLSEDIFRKRSQKLNPSVEAPMSRLLDHIKEHITAEKNEKETKIHTKVIEEEKLILTMETKLAGLPFTWKFQASACSQEMVADHLTTPLMSMVGELLRRQGELAKLLQNKDKEIDDYRNQGAKVTRKHLQTSMFDETAFKDNMETSQGFEQQVRKRGANAFDEEGQNLYQSLMMKAAFLDRTEDSESEDLEDESLQARNSTSPKKNATQGQGHSWTNRLPGSLVSPGSGSTSPSKSPTKSPTKLPDAPVKDAELLRRQALEKRLLEEEEKQEEKQKKKKKKLKI